MARATAQALDQDDTTLDHGDLDDLIGYNLKRAYVVVSTDFRRALGEDGFAPRVFAALSLIVRFPGITQSELARRMGIERSGLVAIIDELERGGHARRRAVPSDRRVQALAPTKAGQEAYQQARAAVRAHEAALLAEFSPAEIETLATLLKKIRDIGS